MQNIEVKSYFKLYIKLIQHYYYHKVRYTTSGSCGQCYDPVGETAACNAGIPY